MSAVYQFYPKRKRSLIKGLSLTIQLIIINVILYFISLVFIGIFGESFLRNFALIPELVLTGKTVWSLLTSMFLHGSFFHLFANMFSLFFIGNFLERIIGKKRFFLVYLIAGLFGGVFYICAAMVLGNIDVPAVGASGAIFGLIGVLAFLVPNFRINLIAGPLVLIVLEVVVSPFLPASIAITFSMIINILIILMIFAIFSFNPNFRRLAIPIELPMWLLPIVAIVPLTIIGFFVNLPIGNSAHFGGLIIGLIYGFYLRKKFPNKIKMISRQFR